MDHFARPQNYLLNDLFCIGKVYTLYLPHKTNNMKALDIVRTPKGAIGFITETKDNGQAASITFIGDTNKEWEKNAWWDLGELEIIDSIPKMIATAMCHPFGQGHKDVLSNFKI